MERWSANPPMVGAYDRPLSLTTMTSWFFAEAMLLSASQHIPPVSAPSPTTATTCRSSPRSAKALDRPSAYDRAVEACEFSIRSCSLSARLG